MARAWDGRTVAPICRARIDRMTELSFDIVLFSIDFVLDSRYLYAKSFVFVVFTVPRKYIVFYVCMSVKRRCLLYGISVLW